MQITNRIHFRNLQGDIFGGVTAAIISLPLAFAFGGASGAGSIAGLYKGVCVGFFAALFGGTPTLILELTEFMTVVMTAIVAKLTASDPEDGLAMAFTVVMLAGIFQIIFGIFKLGKYVTLMLYSVISGFMSGIGVILIILQIAPFLGQAASRGGVIGTLQNLSQLLANINPADAILGGLTLVILFLTPSKLKRFIPPQPLALILSAEKKQLLDRAQGCVLLFYLSGHMIFGLSKAIAREHAAMQEHDVLILDLSDVPLLGVTASLAIENTIKDALGSGCHVFIVSAANKIQQRLERLEILDFLPFNHVLMNRWHTLEAVALVGGSPVEKITHTCKGELRRPWGRVESHLHSPYPICNPYSLD